MVLHDAHVIKRFEYIEHLEHEIAWYDFTQEADYWAKRSGITRTEAAMLLCRFEPREQSYDDAKRMSTGDMRIDKESIKNESSRLQNLERGLMDVEREDPRPRTLRDWHQAARTLGLAYHPWIDRYMEATASSALPVADTIAPEPQAVKTAEQRQAVVVPAPVPDPATPTAAAKIRSVRRTWLDVAGPYIVQVMKAEGCTTAKELFRALEKKAGPNSPFDRGFGNNREKLYVREIAQSLSVKTVQNNWEKVRELAQK